MKTYTIEAHGKLHRSRLWSMTQEAPCAHWAVAQATLPPEARAAWVAAQHERSATEPDLLITEHPAYDMGWVAVTATEELS